MSGRLLDYGCFSKIIQCFQQSWYEEVKILTRVVCCTCTSMDTFIPVTQRTLNSFCLPNNDKRACPDTFGVQLTERFTFLLERTPADVNTIVCTSEMPHNI